MKNIFNYKFILCSGCFILITILIYVWVPDLYIWLHSGTRYEVSGQIGDVIGGTTTPLIAIIAAYLTFLAFWVQYLANKQQREDISIERFESRFYEMLHLHRENLFDLTCGITKGREVFTSYCYKLNVLYILVNNIIEHLSAERTQMFIKYSSNNHDQNIEKTKTVIAYNFFLYGANYSQTFEFNSDEKKLYDIISAEIGAFESKYIEISPDARYTEELLSINFADNFDYYIGLQYGGLEEDINDAPAKMKIPDILLCGSNEKLGVYYRQLYQIAKFIILKEGLLESQRYEYMRIVRSQMSDYEQILLYYNSLAPNGQKWNEKMQSPSDAKLLANNKSQGLITSMGIIARFRLIKNIPSSFSLFGHLPDNQYINDLIYYEKIDKNINFFESRKITIAGIN